MNESVLYQYIAEQLHTYIRIYDKEAHPIQTYSNRQDIHDDFVNSPKILALLFKLHSEPQLCSVNNLLSYMTVPVKENYCIIGPVSVCSDCITQYQIPELVIPYELVQRLYTAGSSNLIRIGIFLYNLFSDSHLDLFACYNQNCSGTDLSTVSLTQSTKLLFYHEEYGEQHNPYEQEIRELASIENGDLNQLKQSWLEDYSGNIGKLSNDPLRNAKYLCLVIITLSTRAAIRGGLPYEMAFSLSDVYCQQIDALDEDGLQQIEGIIRNIQLTLTKLVAQQKGDYLSTNEAESPISTRAKNYIFSHLHKKLAVNDVADALDIHPNYLNRIFKQTEGITIHAYILREKINLSRNMLVYSDYSYIEISNYLGFASQSHLGNIFKKFTGLTLKQYRDAYKKHEF